MKLKLATFTLCTALSLGGCATTGGVSPTDIASAVAAVQSATVTACGFLPTAATVSGILASLIPGASAIEQEIASVAGSICAAVMPAKNLRRLGARTVRGVVIHGRFVR